MRNELPGACSVTEFLGGFNGDCGPIASYLAVHSLPGGQTAYPISEASIVSWVQAQVSAGLAASNGAQNIPSMDTWLTDRGIPHTTVGYDAFTLDGLHNALLAFKTGSQTPIVAEYSAAGAGFLTDEHNVQFHFNTWLGVDTDATAEDGATGGYLCGDGDANVDPPGAVAVAPLVRSWAEIVAAQPIAYIILEAQPVTGGITMSVPANWHDAGGILTAPNGVDVVEGFRDWVLAHAWDSANYPLAAEYGSASIEPGNPAIGAGTRQDFRLGSLGYTTSRGVYVIWIGQDFRALLAKLQQITAAPAPVPPVIDPQTQADATLGAAYRATVKQAMGA